MNINFNVNANNTIKDLQNYINTLSFKCEELANRLCEVGIPVINKKMSMAKGDSNPNHSTFIDIENNGNTITATLTLQGEDVAFIEFGAGIYYNDANEHPKASELGLGVGTYPDQTHAFEKGWWYEDAEGNKHYSHGTEATMPLYSAEMEMINKFYSIADEVFKK